MTTTPSQHDGEDPALLPAPEGGPADASAARPGTGTETAEAPPGTAGEAVDAGPGAPAVVGAQREAVEAEPARAEAPFGDLPVGVVEHAATGGTAAAHEARNLFVAADTRAESDTVEHAPMRPDSARSLSADAGLPTGGATSADVENQADVEDEPVRRPDPVDGVAGPVAARAPTLADGPDAAEDGDRTGAAFGGAPDGALQDGPDAGQDQDGEQSAASGTGAAEDEPPTVARTRRGEGDGDWAFADRPAPFGGGAAPAAPYSGSLQTLPGDGPWEFGAHTAARRPLIVGETTHEIPVHLLFRDEADPAVRRPVVVGRRRGTGEQPRVRRATRPAPPLDPKFTERPGPALPGWAAAFAGLLVLFGCAAVLWWTGAVPGSLVRTARLTPQPYHGIAIGQWLLLTLGVLVMLFTFGGLSRGRVGHALVLTLFGEYRGSVRRTGLLWISPLLLRRRVDTRLRHWRSEPMPAVDANGTALRVVVLVVWRVRDTVRATLGIRDHEEFLREQVEAAMARVMSQLPADAFHETGPTLRNAEAVGDSLTRMLSGECRAAGMEVFSAQPTRIEYAPEIAEAMQRSRIAALDARHRDSVLTAVVDAVDDTVHRLTSRGLVELDDYERKALVKDLTVAFYTGRQGSAGRY